MKKLTKDSLHESDEKYKAIYENAPLSCQSLDENGRIIDVNPLWLTTLGYNKEEVIDKWFGDFLAPEYVDHFKTNFPVFKQQGYINDVQFKMKCKDGRNIDVSFNGKIGYYPNGDFKQTYCVFQDITRQKQVEERLGETEKNYRTIFNSVNEAIFIHDAATGEILDVNEPMLKMYGYDNKVDLLNNQIKLFKADPEYSIEKALQILQKTVSEGPQTFEWQTQKKNGEKFWAEVSLRETDIGGKDRILAVVRNITERRKEKEALQKSKERWESLFNNSPNAIAIYQAVDDGNDFVFTDFNKTAQKVDKLNHEDVIGKRISELFPSAEGLGFLDVFRKVMRTGKTEYMQITNYKDDRIEGWRDNIIYKLNTGEIVAIYNDVTDRMKAEIALKEKNVFIQTVLDNLPLGIALNKIDEGTAFYWNKKFEEIYGWPADVLKDVENFFLKVYPEKNYRNEIIAKVMSDMQTGDPSRMHWEDCIVTHMDGSKHHVNAVNIPLYDQNTMVSTVADITAMKTTEIELRESNELNKSLLQTIPFGIDIVDEEGNILFQSEMLGKIFGSNSKVKKCWQLYRDDKTQCHDCPLLDGIHIGETSIYEAHGVMGGRTFQISHTGMMFKGKKAILEIFQDITERKLGEIELIKAKEKAEESDRLKTAFLQNISHEIRTPMNAIIGFSGFLNNPELTAEKRVHYTEIITQSSKQLLSIITDIITIATIETGQEKISEKEINLNETIKLIYAQFVEKAQKNNISLRFETSLHDNDDVIKTDKTKLEGILSNLIGNALKFIKKGHITFGYRVKARFIEFYVEDTGIGIPEEMHDEIFKRFRQVETSESRQYGGSGLGLSISKAYVELLGGKIWVASEPGKGSTFYFTIPYHKANKEAQTIYSPYRLKLDLKSAKTILVAEDEDSNFMLLEELLADTKINIIRAVNGEDAVEICKTNLTIDLVLMDIKMPKMDGLEATKQIKARNPNLIIVAQTAYSMPEERKLALKAGCDAFVTKPINANALIRLLETKLTE